MRNWEMMMDFDSRLARFLERPSIVKNPEREQLIRDAVERREAIVTVGGALATWTPPESTGRSPQDTLTVQRPESSGTIDWDSPNNIPIDEETFDMVLEDAFSALNAKPHVYELDRVIGADPAYALPVKLLSPLALTSLFADNMFRPVPENIETSVFANRPFTLLALPYNKLDPVRYKGRLRVDPRIGGTSTMVIAMDLDRCIGVVIGSAYCGSVKKLMFSVMNYLLPAESILPLHCSANEGPDGD
ncbi:phosphoenolpyruvate carboxykinase (ATP), partial [Candidatus Bipolaricaulota bacterium]|nr:phosphoenolpyruvate carboxykinase (ATP) [Candidatus Bipolaricaulota bacterium]